VRGTAKRQMTAPKQLCRQGELYVWLVEKTILVEIQHQRRWPVAIEHYDWRLFDLTQSLGRVVL
jgi:hypothetical protein